MKKIIVSIVCVFVLKFTVEAQNKNYWIVLKDKKNNAYSVSHPEVFLSERAIERRNKQNIRITEQDLPLTDLYVDAIKNTGAHVLKKSKWFNAVLVETSNDDAIHVITNFSFVKKISELSVASPVSAIDKFSMENTLFPVEADAGRTNVYDYGLSLNQVNQIGVDCMHNNGFNGTGLVIAVLDAGFYNANILPAFDSLRNNNQILGCRDFVMGDTLVYEDNQHGMMVLSLMGGNLPGRLVGTAPKAKYWLLRTEDAATESMQEEVNWLAGAEFADSVGADVINSSLGYSYFDDTTQNHSYADMDGNTTIITKAADWAASKGIFVCSSAGNAAGPPWYKITAPADADSILTVGAVDSMGVVTGFSSRGPTYDGRIKPNTAAKGYQAVVAAPWGDIQTGNGTSFSSPITAGAVACLWQAHPAKTNMELLLAIEQSANQAASPDTLIGYGIPNFCTASTLLTGVEENTGAVFQVSVYPNPFSGSVTLSCFALENDQMTVEVIDIEGKLILKRKLQVVQNTMNTLVLNELGQLNAGMYFIKLMGNRGTVSVNKLVKN